MSKFLLVVLVTYISITVGIALGSIGKVPDCAKNPYTFWLPIEMFILLSIPAVLGYWIGKDES